MTDNTTKPTKTRNRQITFDSLRVHAAKLDLESKVKLRNELNDSIAAEIARLHEAAKAADALVKG